MLGQIDSALTAEERKDPEKIESAMQRYCDAAKGKDKTMVGSSPRAPAAIGLWPEPPTAASQCYYMGVGDKDLGTAGGVKREISSSFGRGINAKRLCSCATPLPAGLGSTRHPASHTATLVPLARRLKSKDAQMCELRYEKKVDVRNTDLTKLRVKELRKICDDEGIDTKSAPSTLFQPSRAPPLPVL